MRAVLFHAARDFRFDEIDEPELGATEVRVNVAYNGVCGTDLHLFYDPEHSGMRFDRDADGAIVPKRVGHEYAGTIAATGSEVDLCKVGDRVAVYPIPNCGVCAKCVSGAPPFACIDLPEGNGGAGQSVTIDQRFVHHLPDSVSLLQGAMVEPLAVSRHTVGLAELSIDDVVVVAGAGPIGIGIFLDLKARGIDNVIVSEPTADRRAVIEKLGAVVIDPTSEDLAAKVDELSGGLGADAFFDAAGSAAAFAQGLALLGAYGRLVVVAIHGAPVSIDLWPMQADEKRIIGVMGHTQTDFDEVIEGLARGAYPADGWVAIRPWEDFFDVIEELHEGRGTKVILGIS